MRYTGMLVEFTKKITFTKVTLKPCGMAKTKDIDLILFSADSPFNTLWLWAALKSVGSLVGPWIKLIALKRQLKFLIYSWPLSASFVTIFLPNHTKKWFECTNNMSNCRKIVKLPANLKKWHWACFWKDRLIFMALMLILPTNFKLDFLSRML